MVKIMEAVADARGEDPPAALTDWLTSIGVHPPGASRAGLEAATASGLLLCSILNAHNLLSNEELEASAASAARRDGWHNNYNRLQARA